MRQRLVWGVFLGMWLLGAMAVLFAQQGGDVSRPPFDPNKVIGGEIKKINADKKSFDVERLNRRTGETVQDTVYCTEKTVYQKEGAEAKFSDFKEGDRVFANGERKERKFIADRVVTGRPRRSDTRLQARSVCRAVKEKQKPAGRDQKAEVRDQRANEQGQRSHARSSEQNIRSRR